MGSERDTDWRARNRSVTHDRCGAKRTPPWIGRGESRQCRYWPSFGQDGNGSWEKLNSRVEVSTASTRHEGGVAHSLSGPSLRTWPQPAQVAGDWASVALNDSVIIVSNAAGLGLDPRDLPRRECRSRLARADGGLRGAMWEPWTSPRSDATSRRRSYSPGAHRCGALGLCRGAITSFFVFPPVELRVGKPGRATTAWLKHAFVR